MNWSSCLSKNVKHALLYISAPLLMLSVLSQPAYAVPFQQDGGADGIVSMEAENFDLNTASASDSWDLVTPAGASSGEAMQALPNDGDNNNSTFVADSPRLDYEIEFVATGQHFVWLLGTGPSPTDDSMHVGLDGLAVDTSDRISPMPAAGGWVSSTMDGVVAVIDVATTGVHTLNLWMREDGVIADKLLLTTNAGFVPTGLGPAESPRGATVATPVLSPPGGTYTSSQQVSMTTTTVGADIYYTTDGSTPTSGSILFTGPITVDVTQTIQAIGILSGSADSAVATESYVISSGGNNAFQQGTGPDAIVSIEAENFDQNVPVGTHGWVEVQPAGISGSGAMQALPNDGTNINSGFVTTSPRVDYEIEFSSTGTHYVWIRGTGPTGADNSVHVGLDGAFVATSDRITPLPRPDIGWVARTMDGGLVATVNVSSTGLHTLNLYMREDGSIVDKLLLTTNAAFVPTGLGPDESPRGPGQGVSQPALTPAGGTYGSAQSVVMSTATAGAEIYFTTDGTLPDASSTLYTTPVDVSTSQTLRAIGILAGLTDSPVTNEDYIIDLVVEDPVLSPVGGSYSSAQQVVMTTATAGADIFFTTDGSVPDSASTLYTSPVTVDSDQTLRAIALLSGFTDSQVVTEVYVIADGGDAFQQDSGADGIVSIEVENFISNTAGASDTWDLVTPAGASGNEAMQALPNDGTSINTDIELNSPRLDYQIEFLNSGLHYVWVRGLGATGSDDSVHVGLNGAVLLTSDRIAPLPGAFDWVASTMGGGGPAVIDVPSAGLHTLNLWMREDGAVADKLLLTTNAAFIPTGFGPAQSAQGQTVGTPVLTPAGGTYTSAQLVSMTSSTVGADIHFTVDGSTPDATSPIFTTPISVDVDQTIRAIGILTGLSDSAVATEAYVINLGNNLSFQQGTDRGFVSMEAENFHQLASGATDDWISVTPAGMSGGAAMQALPNDGTFVDAGFEVSSPRMDYQINFIETGTHYVWVRGFGASGADDSVHVGFDGLPVATSDRIGALPSPSGWINTTLDGPIATIEVTTPGIHTFNVWMREDGAVIDKLLLTTSSFFLPGGFGPAESPQEGQVATPELSPLGGTFTVAQQVVMSTTTAGASIYYTTDGTTPDSSSLLYTTPVTVDVTQTLTAIGLLAGFTDSDLSTENYVIELGPGAFQQDSGADGIVSMEAENFTSNTAVGAHSWSEMTLAAASNGLLMEAIPNNGTTNNSGYSVTSPRMDFQVNFDRAGVHYVWVRGEGPSNRDDSVHVGLNGVETATSDRIGNFPSSLGWVNGTLGSSPDATVNIPSAGIHTINVWMREDGLRVDKLLLTSSSSFTPTGDGPTESPQGPTVETPVITPSGGTFFDSVDVTISTGTVGAAIHYTVDGSIPDDTSTLYTVPFALTSSATVRAIAILTGSNDSSVSSADFVVTTGSSAQFQQSTEAGNIVSIEAENFAQNTGVGAHTWEPVVGSTLSGAGMQALPDNGTVNNVGFVTLSPRLDYPVNFVTPGLHYVWVRGIGPASVSNSVHVGLNGVAVDTSDRISPFDENVDWVQNTIDGVVAQITVPSAGLHTVNIWMREDGLIVDKFLLTTDQNLVPTGFGPAQSAPGGPVALPISDDFSDGDSEGWVRVDNTGVASVWDATSGLFDLTVSVGSTQSAAALDGAYHLGTYQYLDLNGVLNDFRADVDIELTSTLGNECGLMWRYKDDANYYRLATSFRDGNTLLQKRSGGDWMTLSKNALGTSTGQAVSVRLDVQGSVMQVEVDGVPILSAYDGEHSFGSLGLYGRGSCTFDDVSVVELPAASTVRFVQPVQNGVVVGSGAIARASVINPPVGGSVDFEIDGVACGASSELADGLFEAVCSAPIAGSYDLTATLRDSVDAVVDVNTITNVGFSGYNTVTIGDSITNGSSDTFQGDGQSADGRQNAYWGFQSNLNDLLSDDNPAVGQLIYNTGVPGDASDDVASRISGFVEQHFDANRALLLAGTNDSLGSVDSGLNCTTDCAGTYIGNVQQVVDELNAAGMDVHVALPPALFGDAGGVYTSPETEDTNIRVEEYAQALTSQLTGATIGPDFYDYFLRDANRVFLYSDNLHPNGLGEVIFAKLWHNALSGDTTLPYIVDSIEVRLTGGPINPLTYKLDLLDSGDELFVDNSAVTLLSAPALLDDGRWIRTVDGHRAQSNGNYLTMDVGTNPVTVYVAYDAGATSIPAWLSSWTLESAQVTTNDANVPALDLYSLSSATGVLTLGGADSVSTGAAVNYVVIVVE